MMRIPAPLVAGLMMVVLRNTGHWLPDENPRETTNALLRFL